MADFFFLGFQICSHFLRMQDLNLLRDFNCSGRSLWRIICRGPTDSLSLCSVLFLGFISRLYWESEWVQRLTVPRTWGGGPTNLLTGPVLDLGCLCSVFFLGFDSRVYWKYKWVHRLSLPREREHFHSSSKSQHLLLVGFANVAIFLLGGGGNCHHCRLSEDLGDKTQG